MIFVSFLFLFLFLFSTFLLFYYGAHSEMHIITSPHKLQHSLEKHQPQIRIKEIKKVTVKKKISDLVDKIQIFRT